MQLWQLFMLSQIYVSPSVHDGTPNSLLEAMAYGCFPVVGDIESMHEWIENRKNGCLVDANSPDAVAKGILFALESNALRKKAAIQNAHLISEHAELKQCMNKVEAFYKKVLKN